MSDQLIQTPDNRPIYPEGPIIRGILETLRTIQSEAQTQQGALIKNQEAFAEELRRLREQYNSLDKNMGIAQTKLDGLVAQQTVNATTANDLSVLRERVHGIEITGTDNKDTTWKWLGMLFVLMSMAMSVAAFFKR